MKKLFVVLALAGVMAACGGNEKKEDPKALAKQAFEALQNEDYEAFEAIGAKVEKLSEAEQAEVEKELTKLMEEASK